jgi:L1 cell adhesion molecule like protein
MRNTLDDQKLASAFTEEDKTTINATSAEGLQWIESNREADADAVNGKQKELEKKFNPIMMRVYQATGAQPGGMPGMPGGMPGQGPTNSAPTDAGVDDLD